MNRLKGIPEATIEYTAKQKNCDTLDIYCDLFHEKKIEFDLTGGGSNCGFKFENKTDMGVRSYANGEMTRQIKMRPSANELNLTRKYVC